MDNNRRRLKLAALQTPTNRPDGSVSGLLNTAMSSQKVFVPAITNSEHTASVGGIRADGERDDAERDFGHG